MYVWLLEYMFYIESSAFISNIIFTEQIDKHEQMHMFVYRIEMNCVYMCVCVRLEKYPFKLSKCAHAIGIRGTVGHDIQF